MISKALFHPDSFITLKYVLLGKFVSFIRNQENEGMWENDH